ncbi:MAG: hypothetical protein ACXACI_06265 [Candidatus Hodarchaeales archaeon]|jgi:DNA-binding transcriptional regulator YhcF (GntR family)
MEEDIRSLKARVLQLTQEAQLWHEENARLKARISEYYEWSQQATATIENLRAHIERLEHERNELVNREKQRQQDAGEMTFERLLKENQRIEVEGREFKEDLQEAATLLFRLFQASLSAIDDSLRDKAADFLWKRGDESSRVFVGALRKGGVGDEQELARELGVSVTTVRRVSEGLEQAGTMSKASSGEVMLSKEVRMSSALVQPEEWESLEVEELFSSALNFFDREKDHLRIAEALQTLRDVLASKIGHSVFFYEIARESADWKKEPGESAWLRRKVEMWKEKAMAKIAGN